MSVHTITVHATHIGEYIRHGSCERRFKLDNEYQSLGRELPFLFELSSSMDPILAQAGKQREQEWEQSLRATHLLDLCRYAERPQDEETPWQLFTIRAACLGFDQTAFGREISVSGTIGVFRIAGRMDFALVLWRNGRPILRLVECKASRKDHTYHRIQLVLYRMLVRQALINSPVTIAGIPLSPDDIECVVARIDESTNRVHDILALPPLDLDIEEADVKVLLAPGGPLERILQTDRDALPFQLDSRCDDCSMSACCLPEAARQRRLELLGNDPSTVRALQEAGVQDLDALAVLDLASSSARQIRSDAGFTHNLPLLQQKARARRMTLPRGGDPADHEVIALKNAGKGQLPGHEQNGVRLVRVFLSVNYDYVENRIGALAAHVTRSDRPISTLFSEADGRFRPNPVPVEQWKDEANPTVWRDRPIQGGDFAVVQNEPWTGKYDEDTVSEAKLLEDFFQRLIKAITAVSKPDSEVPVHIYIWSRQEITRLVEACARAGTELLGHLRELLGCRESLEQLIYSCLEEEVENRYALGWTGRGLTVATGLKWFGRSFHWTRMIDNEEVAFDRVFSADIFNWRSRLRTASDGTWRPLDDQTAARELFEVQARFSDNLPAPYWRAHWNTLPDESTLSNPRARLALRKYRNAGRPNYLRHYLRARTQALRWVEESIRFKNEEIAKPLLSIADLRHFTLGVENAARAAVDFLLLEHHVKVTDWVAAHLVPPAARVPQGRTIPLRNVHAIDDNLLRASIDMSGYPIDLEALKLRATFGVGDFVRVSPCKDNPEEGQSVGGLLKAGMTCIISRLDWEKSEVEMSSRFDRADGFLLASHSCHGGEKVFDWATLDVSPSDYVGGKVLKRLQNGQGAHAYRWFDPINPEIPAKEVASPGSIAKFAEIVKRGRVGEHALAPDQAQAALAGIGARVQLLQGPPGTGKTQTTAAATLLRILARATPGDVILVTGNTHNAVDGILKRIALAESSFRQSCLEQGCALPLIKLARADPKQTAAGIIDFPSSQAASFVPREAAGSVLVIGSAPNGLLKLVDRVRSKFKAATPPSHNALASLVVWSRAVRCAM